MAEAARAAEEAGADLVDVNMGCPVPKICKTGAGGAARRSRGRRPSGRGDGAGGRHPVTVKMRRGLPRARRSPWRPRSRLESAGAAALCVHPRGGRGVRGTADHRITAEVVEAVAIPVIASGDVSTPDRARRVLEDTGCAAIAIGRGALGYPWAFGDILRGVPRPTPSLGGRRGGRPIRRRRPAGPRRRARVRVHAQVLPWYLAGHGVPTADLEVLLTTPTLDEALQRLGPRGQSGRCLIHRGRKPFGAALGGGRNEEGDPMDREVILTEEGYLRLKEEIEYLSTSKRREVAERIKEAREFGDIAENSSTTTPRTSRPSSSTASSRWSRSCATPGWSTPSTCRPTPCRSAPR